MLISKSMPPTRTPFVELMATSHRRVLSLRMLLVCCEMSIPALARTLSPTSVMLLWALAAPALTLPILLVDHRTWNFTLIFVVGYLPLTYLLFDYPLRTWTRFQQIADQVEALLRDADASQQFADWLAGRLTLSGQIAASSIGVLIVLLLAVWLILARHLSLLSCVPYLLTIVVVTFLGTNTLWWLWNGPPLARQLRGLPLAPLDWVDPLETPGIAAARQLLLDSARRAFIGAVLTLLPIAISTVILSASPSITALVLVGSTVTFSTLLFILTFAQYWLRRIAREHRDTILADLRHILSGYSHMRPDPELLAYLALYRWVSERRLRVWDFSVVAQMLIAVTGAVGSCTGAVIAFLQ